MKKTMMLVSALMLTATLAMAQLPESPESTEKAQTEAPAAENETTAAPAEAPAACDKAENCPEKSTEEKTAAPESTDAAATEGETGTEK